MAVVVLPRSLIVLFPGAERRVEAEGATVALLIEGLDLRWPGVRDRLCQRNDALREFINVYVDGLDGTPIFHSRIDVNDARPARVTLVNR